jgi:hypothetical protein
VLLNPVQNVKPSAITLYIAERKQKDAKVTSKSGVKTCKIIISVAFLFATNTGYQPTMQNKPLAQQVETKATGDKVKNVGL